MKDLSELEQHVLNAASDDYEAPHTIANDLALYLGRAVSEEDVATAFVRLARLELVQAFQYNSIAQQFQPVPASAIATVEEPWFLAKAHPTLASLSNFSSRDFPSTPGE
ncbi:hypothetical protein [Dokdonella immobilis]|uniref:hypothetical protein n=1 Tax=Dokdonella immobilis TaxID=578942 RepID=UPI001113BDAA|nr:hypothetical protein [Dokdonella immobilis]